MTLDIDKYKAYIALHDERKKILDRESAIKEEMALLEGSLIENLLDNDMSKLNVGNRLAYIAEDIKPIVLDKWTAIYMLKKNGYADYVSENYNWQQVKRLIKDILEESETLPACFNGLIEYKSESKLRVRKA